MRDFHFPGRSPVVSTNGMVASSCVEASLAALDVLRRGGNAMDAAIAGDAVLGVVEPQQTGIGGDVFAIYARNGAKPVAYNGSGRAPAAATHEAIAAAGVSAGVSAGVTAGVPAIATESAHAVTIPGAVEAWARLNADHGSKPLDELLQPAIALAEDGFAVSQRVAWDWGRESGRLAHDTAAAGAMLRDGRAPSFGDVVRNPALASTLRAIGREGPAAFYSGWAADAMVAHLRAFGGLHASADFAAARGEYVEPFSGPVRDCDLLECPPNTQGFAALLMLGILEGFDIAGLPPNGAERLHLEIEAGRIAMEIRNRLLADDVASAESIRALLAPESISALRARIRGDRAATAAASHPGTAQRADSRLVPASQNTVYVAVVDRDRNVASFISSIYHYFGSGLRCPETGVLFHSRGSGFSLDPSHPNCIAPRKRPMHTIMPALLCRDGAPVMPFGVVGGDYQPYGQARIVSNLLACGMDIQEAIDAPRAFLNDGCVDVEQGYDESVVHELRRMGHRVRRAPLPIGGAQGVWIDAARGVLTGGSDPRKDGCVLGY